MFGPMVAVDQKGRLSLEKRGDDTYQRWHTGYSMPISEAQLSAWTTPGTLTGSAATHRSIKAALDAHSWPDGMSFETYLQGSYGNHTNIRGNGDVDLWCKP